jgi:hypothetical protein
MAASSLFPPLDGFEPTRGTLQWYSRAVGVVPRAHATPQPHWWHISLQVQPYGLVTQDMALPAGGSFDLRMDLRRHRIVLAVDGEPHQAFDMTAGLTATAMGDALLAAVAGLGLKGEYARQKFEDTQPRTYHPAQAQRFLDVLIQVDRIFRAHRATLPPEVGPVQLWPHGFDLAFEWFGTRVQRHEEEGEVQELPAQLNLGFYPGNTQDAYFYSNPWPFESDALLGNPLPRGARWHTEGWQGTMLPYAELAGDPAAEQRLRDYARAVYQVAAPTLMAGYGGDSSSLRSSE